MQGSEKTMRRIRGFLAAACALCAAGAVALPSDNEQPIDIVADRAEADDQRQITVYRGDVVFEQGTIRITGDVLTIHYDENREVTKMVVLGEPAHFQQQPDEASTELQRSRARRMEYYTQQDVVVLLGDAHAWQGKEKIEAERIVYDTFHGRVKADTEAPRLAQPSEVEPAEETGRVRIRIVPDKNEDKVSGECPEGQAECP